jgi:hypothetical protein
MAGFNYTMSVEPELRLCSVDGELGYFHCWEQFSYPVAGGLTYGSPPPGFCSQVRGIVEFGDGSVMQVDPERIIFCDERHSVLCGMSKANKTKDKSNTESKTKVKE